MYKVELRTSLSALGYLNSYQKIDLMAPHRSSQPWIPIPQDDTKHLMGEPDQLAIKQRPLGECREKPYFRGNTKLR